VKAKAQEFPRSAYCKVTIAQMNVYVLQFHDMDDFLIKVRIEASIFNQPSIYIDGWLYGMRMTSVVCNVPVLSQNDSTYHHSVFTT